jgi:hypothetical protein
MGSSHCHHDRKPWTIHLQHGRGKKREETTKMAKILNRDAFTPAFKTIDWSHIFLFRLLHWIHKKVRKISHVYCLCINRKKCPKKCSFRSWSHRFRSNIFSYVATNGRSLQQQHYLKKIRGNLLFGPETWISNVLHVKLCRFKVSCLIWCIRQVLNRIKFGIISDSRPLSAILNCSCNI